MSILPSACFLSRRSSDKFRARLLERVKYESGNRKLHSIFRLLFVNIYLLIIHYYILFKIIFINRGGLNSQCLDSHAGPICGDCEANYSKLGDLCVSCSESLINLVRIVLLVMMFILFLIIYVM